MINTRRLVRIVPVVDGIRSLALLAIPILAALVVVDYQSSAARTLDPSDRAASASPGKVFPTSPSQQALGLPNTGADVTTTSEAAFTSFDAAAAQTACRNSTDPVCGPFQWDPVPGPNSPIEITITYSPVAPRTGQEVIVTVHVVDADALIGDVTLTFGDEDVVLIPPASILGCEGEAPSGSWAPPAPRPGDVVKTFRHIYGRAGDLTLAAFAASADALNAACPPNPYASQGTAVLPIHVRAE